MENIHVIGQVQGATMAIYICKNKEDADKRAIEQQRRFPILTIYRGITNQFGMVVWEKPKFPGAKKVS